MEDGIEKTPHHFSFLKFTWMHLYAGSMCPCVFINHFGTMKKKLPPVLPCSALFSPALFQFFLHKNFCGEQSTHDVCVSLLMSPFTATTSSSYKVAASCRFGWSALLPRLSSSLHCDHDFHDYYWFMLSTASILQTWWKWPKEVEWGQPPPFVG